MFATLNDLIVAFGETNLCEAANSTSTSAASVPRITQALSIANSRVAAFVRMQSDAPLASIPDDLKGVACKLAYWELISGRPAAIGDGSKLVYYDAPMDYLKDFVATGKVRYQFQSIRDENHEFALQSVDTFQPADNGRIMGQDWIRDY